MAFRLVVEHIPSSGSVSNIVDIQDCTSATFSNGLLDYWSESDGSGSEYLGSGYYTYNNSDLSYMEWPEGWSSDVYIYKYDSKDDIPTSPSTPGGGSGGGGTSQNTAWSATIEYYINNVKTSFFQDQLANENYPTSIDDILNLSVEKKYGTPGVIIHYKKSGSSTMEDYIITAPPGLNYSSISGASIGVEYNYLNKPSVIKLYFTKNTSLTYTVNVAPNPEDGGTTSKSPSIVYYSDEVTISAKPTDGYKFSKWSISNSTGGTPKETTSNPCSFYILDTKYNCTAYFTPDTYKIIYKDKGNTTFSGNNSSSLPKTHKYGTATTLVNGSKTGYKFKGWYKDSACEGTAIKTLGATDYTSDITLFAKWTPEEYTITYNLNGGTIPSSSSAPTTYTFETPTFSLPEPTRSGYTFKGWYQNFQFVESSKITQITKGSTGDKTLFAKWEGNACTVTVNANPSDLTSRLSGGGNYKNGDSVTIKAPSEYGVYKFESWTKNGSFVSSEPQYTFTANGSATYVANFIDNRKSAVFRIHVLDDTYIETSLCEVEIKYGDLDNPNQNSIKRVGNTDIEIDGPNSSISVIKTHISGTDILDKCGTLTSQVFYIFPTSINNEPFINILYNGNVVESEYLYTNTSETFDVYYGNMPKNDPGDGPGEPGDSDNSEITVKFKYHLDDIDIDTSDGEYINWPTTNIDELKCYWFKYDGYTKNDREAAISGSTDRIQFSYVDTYWDDPAKSDPYSNLKYVLEIEAPSFTGLADPVFLSGVNIRNTDEVYTYTDCPNNTLDIDIYFTSYEFNAYVYSNLPDYGDAYIATKGTKHIVFHASSVNPTAIRFDAEVLNNAFYFNRWVNYSTKAELSTKNPWIIDDPDGQDYHVEAEFLGRQINIKLDPNNGKAEAFWQRVGIVAGTNKFKRISFDAYEPIKYPDAKTGYEFLGWYTSETNGNGSGNLIIDKNGVLQSNVPGWTSSDGLWIKGPDAVSPGLIADVVVYAKWKPTEYTITLNPNGGSGSNQTVYVDYLSSTLKSTITNPTKTGHTFEGWYTTASGGSKVIGTDGKLKPNVKDYTNGSSQWIKASGTTLYAHWTPTEYTITLNPNGGSGGQQNVKVDYLSSSLKSTITNPTKTGHTFEGWYTNTTSSGLLVIGTDGKLKPNVKDYTNGSSQWIKASGATLYAVYSINTYQITVNAIPDELKDKVYILKGDDKNNKYTSTTCTTGDKITLVAENTIEYVLSSWKKGEKGINYLNEFTFTAPGNYLDNPTGNNIFTAYYEQDPRATLKINFRVDDAIEKTAIFKFDTTFHFLGDSTTKGYRCEIQGKGAECVEGDISINQQGYFFIPSKYNGEDICMVPHEQGSGTTELICSNKGTTIGLDGSNSQYYEDNTVKNKYCPTEDEWQAYLPTNTADEKHLVFPAVEKEEYGVLYGPLVIDVYYGEIPERFLPVIPEDVEITTVSGLTLLQRIQNKIATFKWLNNLFGEPEKTSWESYDNSGLKSFLKDDSKETPSSIHCIEYGDLQIYNQGSGNGNINLDKTIKQYSLTSDKIIKPLNGQVELKVSKIEGNKIYFNISNSSVFTNTSDGIYIYFSVNNETNENNATLYKMKLPKSSSNKGLLLTIPDVSNIESLYIYRTPIMVDSTKTGITPKILFSSEKEELPISVHDRTTLNTVI